MDRIDLISLHDLQDCLLDPKQTSILYFGDTLHRIRKQEKKNNVNVPVWNIPFLFSISFFMSFVGKVL